MNTAHLPKSVFSVNIIKEVFINIKTFILGSTTQKKMFEPTRYYIAGTRLGVHKTNYAILLHPGGVAKLLASGGSYATSIAYKKTADEIEIEDVKDGSVYLIIARNRMVRANGSAVYDEAILQPIPRNNVFAGNTFKGVLSVVNGEGCIAFCVCFSDGHLGYSCDGFASPLLNHNYALQNNGVATCGIESCACSIHFNDQLLFIKVNNHVSVSWISRIDGKHSVSYYGELKQVT